MSFETVACIFLALLLAGVIFGLLLFRWAFKEVLKQWKISADKSQKLQEVLKKYGANK